MPHHLNRTLPIWGCKQKKLPIAVGQAGWLPPSHLTA